MGCIESKNKEKEWEQERAKKEAELKRVIAALSATPFFLQLSDEELEVHSVTQFCTSLLHPFS
jgi:hypothetical protein